jgi:hypothetical protein
MNGDGRNPTPMGWVRPHGIPGRCPGSIKTYISSLAGALENTGATLVCTVDDWKTINRELQIHYAHGLQELAGQLECLAAYWLANLNQEKPQ